MRLFKTEEQRKAAELARKQAEIAKAAANKAYKSEFGMTADQYLQLRGIEVQPVTKVVCSKDKQPPRNQPMVRSLWGIV
ncbi:hypothetical protein HWA77_22700 [Photobacterium damselae subsp. damselae]|uniref:Uncharacterized protein n=1 Tax=Photobacterium damselae subsp. damselae TaxID=85581 RepID=A0A850QWM8_PHODD|nr:hypothetical protein [Photobacterium damselae subsp. damselae]